MLDLMDVNLLDYPPGSPVSRRSDHPTEKCSVNVPPRNAGPLGGQRQQVCTGPMGIMCMELQLLFGLYLAPCLQELLSYKLLLQTGWKC